MNVKSLKVYRERERERERERDCFLTCWSCSHFFLKEKYFCKNAFSLERVSNCASNVSVILQNTEM